MIDYLRAVFPAEFYRNPAHFRGVVLSCVYLLLFILQLFTYEKFYPIVSGFDLPGGAITAIILTGLLPLLELLALPFLLSMRVNKRIWTVARSATIGSPLLWLIIALWLGVEGSGSDKIGIFGATVTTYYGWWVILFFAMILVSAIIVVRELPRRHA